MVRGMFTVLVRVMVSLRGLFLVRFALGVVLRLGLVLGLRLGLDLRLD